MLHRKVLPLTYVRFQSKKTNHLMDMRFLCILFIFSASLVSLFLAFFTFLIVKIFTGKSIGNPNYAPVKGTIFSLFFHYKEIYDYQTRVARATPTHRLLAPNFSLIYTVDPRNVEHVLKTNFAHYSKGAYNQEIMSDIFGQGIFIIDGEMWRHQRKLASYEFSTRVLRDFSCSVFRTGAARLVKVVSEFSDSNRIFDMQDLLMRCTLDSIFKVGFGIELNCLEGSSTKGLEFMKAFDESTALTYWRFVDPLWKFKRFLHIGSEATLKKHVRVVRDFVHHLIKRKRDLLAQQKNAADKEDILSRFLLESEKNPEKMNDKYLSDIILSFMIAGKDTSANTLSWFFYMLSKNPLIQEKVSQEITDVVGLNHGANNADEFVASITEATLEQMHYLHATLSETLRLYPAVPVDGRFADKDDILADGFRVNKGDSVYYLTYAMGRMPYIWGEDAEIFRPERWLKDGKFQPESTFKFAAFHAGPRICLGKDFAYRQMKIVAMALIYFFRFKLANVANKVNYRTMFTLHIDGSLPMLAVRRTT